VGDSVEKELRLAIEEASYVCRLAIDVDVDVVLLLDCFWSGDGAPPLPKTYSPFTPSARYLSLSMDR